MRHPLVLPCSILLAIPASGQDGLGLLRNTDVSYSTRGDGWSPAANPSIQFTRIDVETFAAWGYEDSNPGFRTIAGLHFVIQDYNRATADTFSLVAYTEVAPQANVPDIANPLAVAGPLSLPAGPPGPGAMQVTASFVTPIAAPATADVFVGLHQHQVVNAFGLDGITVWLTTARDGMGQWTVRDLPGGGAPLPGPFDGIAGFYVPVTNWLAYLGRSQFHIEPIVLGPAGVASALHYGDALHPAANTFPGTSCVLSGSYPDARSPAWNAGRADDLGMTLRRTGIPDNSPVLWIGDVAAAFAPEVPLGTLLPGASGVLCVHPTTAVVLGVGLTANGEAAHLISFPPSLRPQLANIGILQQAVVFDPTFGAFFAGPGQLSIL